MHVTDIGEYQLSRVVESQAPFLEASAFIPDVDMDLVEANRDWLFPRFM